MSDERSAEQRERLVEELFEIATHLRADELEGFYARHCAGDPSLRAELESLLAHDAEETRSFLASPLGKVSASETGTRLPATDPDAGEEVPVEPAPSALPERIGPFLILERVGEGGMGSVYRAEQQGAVRREAAVKVIRRGLAGNDAAARFEHERRALALMDHRGIARVLDGGVTSDGLAWFAMEYAPGLPIDRYCDTHELPVRERLELFCQVCDAVQHAHQKGVIHRDLKPSNVLVTERDAQPTVKVIDFGIACFHEDDEEWTRRTRAHEVVGTWHYMSPEQSTPQGADVDTRTDIYALGVLLYKLLAGVLPLEIQALRGLAPSEIHQLLLESDPPPPSRRLARLGDESTTIAENRGTDTRGLVRRIAGDLDWIALKAMERDRSRRYASASELAGDIRRHLADEPVLAGPPNLGYRMTKFVRRNRVPVLAGAAAAGAIIAGTAGLAFGLLQAGQQRDAAEAKADAAREAELEAREAWEHADLHRKQMVAEARNAQLITEFLVDTVALEDPEVSQSARPTLEVMLQRAGEKVDQLEGYPEGEAAVRDALGRGLHSLGLLTEAEEHLQAALDLREARSETPLEDIYATARRLAHVQRESDSRDAMSQRLDAHYLAAQLMDDKYPEVGAALTELSRELYAEAGDSVLPHLERVVEVAEEQLQGEVDKLILADVIEDYAHQLNLFGRSPEEIEFREEVLQIRRRFLPEIHADVAHGLRGLVRALNDQGQYSRAEERVLESLAICEESLPHDHWLLAASRSLLGETLSGQGRDEEAAELLEKSHDALIAARGLESRTGIDSAWRLVRHFDLTGEGTKADAYREELVRALALTRNTYLGTYILFDAFDHRDEELLQALHDLHALFGEPTDGEGWLSEYSDQLRVVVETWRSSLAAGGEKSVIVARQVAALPLFPGRMDGAVLREVLDEVLRVLEPLADRFPGEISECRMILGIQEREDGHLDLAEERFRQALTARLSVHGRTTFDTLYIQDHLFDCLLEADKLDVLEEELVRTWTLTSADLGLAHVVTTAVLERLVQFFHRAGCPERAEPYLDRHLSADISRDRNPARLSELTYNATRWSGYSPELYAKALDASLRATTLAPESDAYRCKLGAALYRMGEFADARRELEACEGLLEEGDRFHAAFLALALARVGEAGAGRELLERQGILEGSTEGTGVLSEARRALAGPEQH